MLQDDGLSPVFCEYENSGRILLVGLSVEKLPN